MGSPANVARRPSRLGSVLLGVCLVGGCSESSPNSPISLGADASEEAETSGGTGGSTDASACHPGDVETYQPGDYHAAAAPGRSVCVPSASGADPISAFYDACLGANATDAQCSAFKADPTTAACAECIVSADTDALYGPLIDHGDFISANVAGCIELEDPSGLSCAKAVQWLGGCEIAACEANCPVHDAASRAAYDACAAQADVGGCSSFAEAAGCMATEADAGAAVCLATTFVDFYYSVVPIFCGPAPSLADAGTLFFDASVDGPSDAAAVSDAADAAQVPDAAGDAVSAAPADASGDGPPDASSFDAYGE